MLGKPVEGLGLTSHHPLPQVNVSGQAGEGPRQSLASVPASPGTSVRGRLLGRGRPAACHTPRTGIARGCQTLSMACTPPSLEADRLHPGPCQLPWVICQKSTGPWAKYPWTETGLPP